MLKAFASVTLALSVLAPGLVAASTDPVSANPNTGASFNRYSYGNNNPYRYTDPDGRDCISNDKTTTCSVKVTGSNIPVKFTVPTPAGWPSKIDSSQSNYHNYDKQVSAGPGSAPKADAIRQAIANDPTPGNDKPASPQGTANNASPRDGLMSIPGRAKDSPVLSYARQDSNGSAITVNVTQPGHPLFPGYVARIVETQGGQSVVHNVGEGTGILQSRFSPFANAINNVWIQQTQDVLQTVPLDFHCLFVTSSLLS
ncbi:hypothetical protein [Xanthomonas citri]|uniref:hypothetical protein n=1 Tax=Xanthomonas citri TaxID=346 RepID=UPI0040476B2D